MFNCHTPWSFICSSMFRFTIHFREQLPYVSCNAPLCACRVEHCGNSPPCYAHFNIRKQSSLMLHGKWEVHHVRLHWNSWGRNFFKLHMHVVFCSKRKDTSTFKWQVKLERNAKKKKKESWKGKAGFNQVFVQSKLDEIRQLGR